MKIISVLLVFYIVLISGCQCVTSIDTPKDINPTFFAHVLFVNAHPNIDEMNVSMDNEIVARSLYYNSSPKSYVNLSPGSRNILITSSEDSVLFNSSLDISDKQNYTFITYGTDNRLQTMFFNDSIPNYSENNAYFRFVDVAPESPIFIVKISDQYPIQSSLQYRSSTKFYPAPAGKYNLQLKNAVTDSLILDDENFELKTGKIYTILIKGYYEGVGAQKMQFHMIENTYSK